MPRGIFNSKNKSRFSGLQVEETALDRHCAGFALRRGEAPPEVKAVLEGENDHT